MSEDDDSCPARISALSLATHVRVEPPFLPWGLPTLPRGTACLSTGTRLELTPHTFPTLYFFPLPRFHPTVVLGLRCSYSDLKWGQQSPLDQCCDVFFSHCTHRRRQSKDERFWVDETRLWVCLRCLSQPQTVGPSQSLKSFTRILRMDM